MPESDEPPAPVEAGASTPQPPRTFSPGVKGMRALAHPVRMQLVGLLRKHGPSTATQLAERLSINSGTASYHLRQLGAAGYVEEDSERGNARERWWRAPHESTSLDSAALAARDTEAATALLRSTAAVHSLRTQRTLNGYETLPTAWRTATDMSDWMLRLTPEEVRQLGAELHAVVERYRRDSPRAATSAPEHAEHVTVLLHLLPDPEPESGPAPRTTTSDETEPTR